MLKREVGSYLTELFLVLWHLLQHLRQFLHGGLRDRVKVLYLFYLPDAAIL